MLPTSQFANKENARLSLNRLVNELGQAQKASQSALLNQRLQKLMTHVPAIKAICVFISLQDEPDIKPFILTCSHRLLLPRQEGPILRFCNWDGAHSSTVKHSTLGVQQASAQLPTLSDDQLNQLGQGLLVLVPGRGFDSQLHRLGRGKGYYDQSLARVPQALRLGLCFDCQLVSTLPHELHDQRMDAVLTTTRFLSAPRAPTQFSLAPLFDL